MPEDSEVDKEEEQFADVVAALTKGGMKPVETSQCILRDIKLENGCRLLMLPEEDAESWDYCPRTWLARTHAMFVDIELHILQDEVMELRELAGLGSDKDKDDA